MDEIMEPVVQYIMTFVKRSSRPNFLFESHNTRLVTESNNHCYPADIIHILLHQNTGVCDKTIFVISVFLITLTFCTTACSLIIMVFNLVSCKCIHAFALTK